MPRLVAERGDVIPVLAEVFREHGYEGASLRLITESTGRGDPAGEWFADGLTDLSRALPGSTVIAQASADTYKDRPVDVRAIGREQGVRYVIEGSVLLADDQVRVNAQLVEAEIGANLWADRFDMPWRDVLRMQDEIVGRLARSAGLRLVDAEARRAERAEHEHLGEGTAGDYVVRARAVTNQGALLSA